MEVADIITINSKIDVQINGEGVFYKSSVQEVTSDYIAIHIPSYRSRAAYLMPGDSIKGRVYTREAQYVFYSTVLGKKMDRVLLFLLAVPSKLKRVQMRDYVRVKTMVPIKYRLLEEGPSQEGERPFKESISIDISGGGIFFLAQGNLPLESLLEVKFVVQNFNHEEVEIRAIARVKRKEPSRERGKVALGVSFEVISEQDRDVLIGYLFRKLLEQKRLGVKN